MKHIKEIIEEYMKTGYTKIHDSCVSCGKETRYEKDTNINLRKYYIQGSGQLCPPCYGELYDGKRT
jgi:tagatose-1,6-bisphosphate aldolase non-catalytic subunit AgaZ/GatZ